LYLNRIALRQQIRITHITHVPVHHTGVSAKAQVGFIAVVDGGEEHAILEATFFLEFIAFKYVEGILLRGRLELGALLDAGEEEDGAEYVQSLCPVSKDVSKVSAAVGSWAWVFGLELTACTRTMEPM